MTGTVIITVINSTVLAALRKLPDKSVQFIMTSPPYLWLRNYKIKGQIGLEKTPKEFIEILVEVFRECWRVLRDDGTFWLNMGDSYAGSGKGPSGHTGLGCQEDRQGFHDENVHVPKGWKAGDLMGIPWLLAFALRDAGWYLRTDIVWHKPNPMPESNKTRPTRAHEFLFLFAKSGKVQFWTHPTFEGTRKKPAPDYYFVNNQTSEEGEPPENWKNLTYVDEETGKKSKLWSRRNRWIGWKYFYDAEAIREPASSSYAKDKRPEGILRQRCNDNTKYDREESQFRKVRSLHKQEEIGKATYADLNKSGRGHTPTANKRDVWKIPTTQRKEKHFASFPDRLVEEAIKAGSSEAGCCPRCGAPYFRRVHRIASTMNIRVRDGKKGIISDKSGLGVQYEASEGEIADYGPEEAGICETLGWAPTCDCNAGDPIPCTVMDPFCGRGTVLIVGRRMSRSGIGIDLNPDYCQMVKKNLELENDKPGIPVMEFNLCEGPEELEIQKSPCILKGQITLDEVTA
ncbi:MAG: site-specific DNA-methyltransferase [Patulibacter sp.]